MAAALANLEKARAVPKTTMYRLTDKRLAANRANLAKAKALRQEELEHVVDRLDQAFPPLGEYVQILPQAAESEHPRVEDADLPLYRPAPLGSLGLLASETGGEAFFQVLETPLAFAPYLEQLKELLASNIYSRLRLSPGHRVTRRCTSPPSSLM